MDALLAGAVLPSNLTPCLPLDVNRSLAQALQTPAKQEEALRMLGLFGWQFFISLNWPAHSGTELPTERLSAPGPPRWYDWNTAEEVFDRASGKDIPWGSARDQTLTPVITLTPHAPSSLDSLSQHQQVDGNLLWDQHGVPVYYETMMNRVMYDNIKENRLTTQEGQSRAKPLAFTWGKVGEYEEQTGKEDAPSQLGVVTLKLAWKALGTTDDRSRFFTRQALTDTPRWAPREFGLVGMHIGYKTSFLNPRWVWLSFEHIDNVPPLEGERCGPQAPAPRVLLFNDPSCSPLDCRPNDPRGENPSTPGRRATQVVRMIPIPGATSALNCEVRAMLHAREPKSPAQYYQLVTSQTSEQSFTRGASPPNFPVAATNTVVETFLQKPEHNCMDCHRQAPLYQEKKRAPGQFELTDNAGDFTYMLTTRLIPEPPR